MIAATNLTAIYAAAATGATAVVVGFVGYLTARLSAGVARTQTEEETRRLREEREETHSQHRQGLYHDLLNQERRFYNIPAPKQREAVREWSNGLNDAVNGVVLFGTAETARAALDLHSLVATMLGSVSSQAGETYSEKLTAAASKVHARRQAARIAFANAVRADAAPDKKPLPPASKRDQEVSVNDQPHDGDDDAHGPLSADVTPEAAE